MNPDGERRATRQRKVHGLPDGAKACQNLKPQEALTQSCRNCHGTGTVFRSRTLKVGNSQKCPVCKGTCKVPYEGKNP